MEDAYELSSPPEAPPSPNGHQPKPLAESDFGLAPAAPSATGPTRLVSLDAYRGFVMLAMASSGLGFAAVAKGFPDSRLWKFLAEQTDHVAWQGLVFWDLIQPSFMFIVGVAMPWAYANRVAKGQGWWSQLGHAVARSLVLIALGVFLSSNGSKQTNWTFVNVLTQIGLGYTFVFLILGWKPPWQWAAALAVLVGYWAYFAFWPLPGTTGTWPVTPSYATLSEHWAKNANAASDFDRWFLNLLPYPDGSGFKENGGGYATLNFIPSIATAIFGVLVGQFLKSGRTGHRKAATLAVAGVVGIVLGRLLDGGDFDYLFGLHYTICPSVKRIWTPSWVVVSTGWACLMMATFYVVIDVWAWRRWAFPLVVVGANSIVMYVMAQLIRPWVKGTLRTHLTTASYTLTDTMGLGSAVPNVEKSGTLFAGPYGPIYEQAAILFVLWLVCLWLYRRRIFVRI
jgi:heparan-alpha-glucosaminide N-acetyltransferase